MADDMKKKTSDDAADLIDGLTPFTPDDGPLKDIGDLLSHLAMNAAEARTTIPESTPPGARQGLARHITMARMASSQIFGTIEGTVVTCVRAGLMSKEDAHTIQREALSLMGLAPAAVAPAAEVTDAPMVEEAPAAGPESGTSAG